jgi:hypothetical protein
MPSWHGVKLKKNRGKFTFTFYCLSQVHTVTLFQRIYCCSVVTVFVVVVAAAAAAAAAVVIILKAHTCFLHCNT